MSNLNFSECFAAYGAKPKNIRWGWSARSDTEVVITLWSDRIKGKNWTYNSDPENQSPGLDSPAKRERLKDLLWARDHSDGRFRVVIAVAEDPDSETRKIKECYPRQEVTMRLITLDETTGEFTAELAA